MREVERIFQLDPEPPVLENMNDYIIEAVRSRELRWFSFFLHCYENPAQWPYSPFPTAGGAESL